MKDLGSLQITLKYSNSEGHLKDALQAISWLPIFNPKTPFHESDLGGCFGYPYRDQKQKPQNDNS